MNCHGLSKKMVALKSAGIETYDSLQLWGIIAVDLILRQAKIAPFD